MAHRSRLLSWRAQVGLHWLLLVIALLGALAGFVPDALPRVAALLPHVSNLDAGLADLSRLDTTDREGKPIAILGVGDRGYTEVYALLRLLDRSLPAMSKVHGSSSEVAGRRIVVSHGSLSYGRDDNKLALAPVVHFERDPGILSQVCFVRDLMALAQQDRSSYCGKWALALTAFAVFLDVALGLWGLLENPPVAGP